jgi:hypothetical protein
MAAGLLVAVCACGCEKSASNPAVSTNPPATTNPAMAGDTTTTQPAVAFLMIDGKLQQFPPALLRLRSKDGQVSALLCTDDPPEAINDTYKGNSFYLPMSLDITDASAIGTAEWKFQAASSDHVDSLEGIFLHGARLQLQPLDVVVDFAGGEPKVTVSMQGRFLVASTVRDGPTTVATFSQVSGTFPCIASEPQ